MTGVLKKCCYVSVALDVPLTRLFEYRCIEASLPKIGARVIVPFGPRRLAGVVLGVASETQFDSSKIRPVVALPNDMPPLPEDVLALGRFCAEYYGHPLGQVLATALPVALRQPKVFVPPEPSGVYQATDLNALLQSLSARATAQKQLALMLAQPMARAELAAASPSASKWLKNWMEAGWVAFTETLPDVIPLPAGAAEANAEQAAAIAAIDGSHAAFAAFLLFGITGSGKTEVYLQTIAACLARGQQALVLVPEINLTPQLEARFRARFPTARIVALHSGLSDKERVLNWLSASRGEAHIVLGTRLAVFTPMPRLGMIVVDEEHDASFKQQEGLRYSARDAAVYRAHQRQVPIVLGSATPALETWHNARSGRYRLITLQHRAVGGAMPPIIEIIPMHRAKVVEGLHQATLNIMRDHLAAGQQVLVFINRRGYAPVLSCGECGWLGECKRCSAKLVLHLKERRLRCHHCGDEQMIPTACPDCGNQDIRPLGQGTQRIEAALETLFPDAKILRIDRDNTRRKGSLQEMLRQVSAGEANLLVGTQMMAKGHDFPALNLVVVLNADAGLFSVDFRGEERMYAQLLQVAGRAGRAGTQGRVLIQTGYHDHPFYGQLLAQDYAAFADAQLDERRSMQLPPFAAYALLRAEAEEGALAKAFLQQLQALLADAAGVQMFDPIAATMQRKAGMERWQLLVMSDTRHPLVNALKRIAPMLEVRNNKVRCILDVDPIEM
ncbi:primosomal protein N' [Iodobacter ciconiae]|uniref:Replication restart protein PriA n=1 Tax=Iodobacter ciconiae TaxID=2496266 RepID=A0A3S8ZR24_9NEIS|nr:primosomal protein N' [Iodobacter ciconiae]AZN35940.1 primosomal protein N' [Iodobacter ciconiae]